MFTYPAHLKRNRSSVGVTKKQNKTILAKIYLAASRQDPGIVHANPQFYNMRIIIKKIATKHFID